MSTGVQSRLYNPISIGNTEDPDEFKQKGLHPVHLGYKFQNWRYRIVHKLCHGSSSTVWLARDEQKIQYAALKIVDAKTSTEDGGNSKELKVLRDLTRSSLQHPGRQYVLTLLDEFWIGGPNGQSLCYVTKVAGTRVARPKGVTHDSLDLSKRIALQLLQGVSYLHACNIAHGGQSCMYTHSVYSLIPDLDLCPGNILSQLDNFDS